jgi:hypothetical protein
VGRGGYASLVVATVLTLAGVLIAPAPAGAYVNPYGRYQIRSVGFWNQCLTVPNYGPRGTSVTRAPCAGTTNQTWHFDRVGWYGDDPIFVIRVTHRRNGGVYTDCLDVPNSNTANALATWTCNGMPAQQWVQHIVGYNDLGPIFIYASMLNVTASYIPSWEFNADDRWPFLGLQYRPVTSINQMFQQDYFGP